VGPHALGEVAVDAVGHRVVHGGELRAPAEIDAGVEAAIRAALEIAPLHNVPALEALERARSALPGVPHVAVFDTGFHATLPAAAATYAVPPEWGVTRIGFHGLSVEWVASVVPVARLVVCHLGGGCSITAVRDGRSVDTTMGFTPLAGVPMATRAGAVDPGALVHLLRSGRLTLEELDHALEHRSGLLALGGSARVDALEAAGDERAELALSVFAHRVAGAVAAMAAAAGGIDALAFTAGIGEGSPSMRERICERLAFLGVSLDPERNRTAGGDDEIGAAGTAVRVHVVHAREELVIARAVERVVGAAG
jgi:acetate kinase